MTTETFSPSTLDADVNWYDSTMWSGGTVPDDSATAVVLPATGSTVHTIWISGTENTKIASLGIDDQILSLGGQLAVVGGLSLQDAAQISTLEGGALFVGGATAVDASSEILASGALEGAVVDDGLISVEPASTAYPTLFIRGAVTGNGLLQVGADSAGNDTGVLELGGANSVPVAYGVYGGTLWIDDPQDFTGVIVPMARSYNANSVNDEYVVLPGLSDADVTSFTYGSYGAGGLVTIVADGETVNLDIAGYQSTSDFHIYAGPQTTSGGPSLVLDITPALTPPTLELPLADGTTTSRAIVNTGTPTVTVADPVGAITSLSADGGVAESYPVSVLSPIATGGTHDQPLITALDPGAHEIVATAGWLSNTTTSNPLDLFVLPAPLAGITTAAIGSFQFGALLDQGYGMNFVSGTEAIQLTDGTLSVGPDTVEASVQRLYEGLLGRGADQGGLAQFTALATASGTAAVAGAILGSPEFIGLHGTLASLGDTAFVTLLYNELLGRPPDAGGLASHVSALQGGASAGSLAAGIADSGEAKAHLVSTTGNLWVVNPTGAAVTELYETAFGQAPDLGGVALFGSALQGGLSVQQLAADLASSPEFLTDHAGQGNAALVTSLYENGLGRAPSAADLQHWAGITAAGVLFGVAASPEAAMHLIRNV